MKMKKIISALLIILTVLSLCSCGKSQSTSGTNTEPVNSKSDILKLSFKSTSGYDFLKQHNRETVQIDGYMATSSPADGSFIFLMNLPYQSCPFCVPNTAQLSNTLECYPKKNKTFDFTNQAIRVTGRLAVADKEEGFSDLYGYSFSFKIEDAEYTIINADELSERMQLWQELANTDVISEVYRMFNYVSFVCAWNTYYVNSFTAEDGTEVTGYYLYAEDALNYIHQEDGQYHYGYVDGYFDSIVNTIEKVDSNEFSELVENVRKAEKLAQKAVKELEDGNYTSRYQHIDMFDTEDHYFTINKGDELAAEMDAVYTEFSEWLGSWEM